MSGKVTRDVAERFWEKVDRRELDECWPWTASRQAAGYGAFGIGQRVHNASRIAFELTHGPVGPGLCVRHRCDNPPCCNPAHLEVGTAKDNAMDKASRGRAPTRLSPQDVREIRIWARCGFTQQDIGDAYGVTQANVWSVVNRKTFAHVEG